MGASLTYARRYALFTLVGIAGEHDLDAPGLAGPRAHGATDSIRPKSIEAVSRLLATLPKNRKPWTPLRGTLASEPSTALRDRLLGELLSLASPDQVTAWAQGALGAKNTLRDVDTAVVEAAFASRMAELGGEGEVPLPSPPEAGLKRRKLQLKDETARLKINESVH